MITNIIIGWLVLGLIKVVWDLKQLKEYVKEYVDTNDDFRIDISSLVYLIEKRLVCKSPSKKVAKKTK